MITEAAGRDSLTRIATISQLAPLLARVAAASSARLSRRLRGAIQPLAVKANVFAVNLRHVTLRAGATSATRAWTAAESSARVARQLPRTVHPLGVMARSVAARLRHGSPQGLAALRLAGRMLRPRSVAAAFAMLAFDHHRRPRHRPDRQERRSRDAANHSRRALDRCDRTARPGRDGRCRRAR